MNPLYIVLPMFILLILVILFMNQYSALEWLFFLCFLCIIAIVGTNYFLGIQLTTVLKNLFTKPEIDTTILKLPERKNPDDHTKDNNLPTSHSPETYHVKGQYDYTMSRAICKAYNGQLATLDQMKNAFQKGAEWCDYGWSEDSMVLYPTQEDSWKEYKKTDDPHQCGIPGINGGYNNRHHQKLGVNCYGIKPPGKMPIYPSPVVVDKPIPHLPVSPFNYKSWFQ